MDAATTRRTIAAGSIGSILEWYDFAVYGFLATVLAAQFFPSENPAAALIATFGVFASGYLMRPVGAVVLGHIGDRVSRKAALILSTAMMAVATGAMAVLPTYQTIGIGAPLLLTALRLVQGLAVGGEYTGSVVLLVEAAPPNRRALLGTVALIGGTIGVMAASGAAALFAAALTPEQFVDWGWRLLYLPAPLLGIVGVLLRRRLVGEANAHVPRLPIVAAVREQGRTLLRVIGICTATAISNYTVFIYGATYLIAIMKIPRAEALAATTAGNAALIVFALIFAWLADRIGRRPVMLFGSIGLLVASYPLFILLRGAMLPPAAVMIGFSLFIGAIAGGLAAMITELFPRAIRYTGVSVGYGLALGILGGTTPLVVTSLIDLTGNDFTPAFYVMFAAAITAATVFFVPETRQRPLD
jgi:MHS family proline/betaine transporter-like MFS transporter